METNGTRMSLKQKLLIFALQHSIRHYQWAARVYQALAECGNNMNSRITLRTLSRSANLHARIDLAILTLLHQPVSNDHYPALGNLWDWILLNCNIEITLAWLGWVEQSYDWLTEVLGKQTRSI